MCVLDFLRLKELSIKLAYKVVCSMKILDIEHVPVLIDGRHTAAIYISNSAHSRVFTPLVNKQTRDVISDWPDCFLIWAVRVMSLIFVFVYYYTRRR